MSSDIYIELRYVLTRPNVFSLFADIDGSTENALESYLNTEYGEEPDFDYIETMLTPLLMCKITGIYSYSFVVDITSHHEEDTKLVTELYLHFTVGGERRRVLMQWLKQYEVPHEFI